MNRGLKTAAVLMLVASVGFGTYQGYEAWHTGSELSLAKQRSASNELAASGWRDTGRELQRELKEEQARTKDLRDASSARSEFDSALESVKGELNIASGKIDISAEQQRIIAAQKMAIAHYSEPGTIRAQAAELNSVAEALKTKSKSAAPKASASEPTVASVVTREQIVAPDSAVSQTVASAPSAVSGATEDWLADMRTRLTAVGGGSAHLEEFDGNCSGVQAVACSFPGGLIKISSEISSWSPAAKDTVLVHELAHQQQFPIMGQIRASAGYQSLFQSDVELLANCMATARGYTAHGVSCSQPQVDWARSIWSGVVPS